MYAVSEEYKIAMKKPVQRFRMTGWFGTIPFNDQNILKGSFNISNQCSDENEVKIGQVYTAELNVTLMKSLQIPRYFLKDKVIKPYYGLQLSDGTYEDIPLGVFNVNEAEWSNSGVVIKAYDNMIKLDKGCNINKVTALPYSLAVMACNSCGVKLATKEHEFSSFVNGTTILTLYADNDIETWRDFLSWVAQAVGCNVMADREGCIVFRPYGQTVVDTIDPEHRFTGCHFSDFITRYTGMSCVNIEDQTTSYYAVGIDDGLTYNLGSNPFLQMGEGDTKARIRTAIFPALEQINYVPFQAEMIGSPVYDLMDVFTFPGGAGDGEKLFCMTKFTFNYHGKYSMSGVGKNPALASAKSKTDKNIAGLMSQRQHEGMQYTVFTNAEEVTVEDKHSGKIMTIDFAVSKKTHCQIEMEVLLEAETTETGTEGNWVEHDAVCTVTYFLNGEKIPNRTPIETWQDGKHILSLHYDLQAVATQIHTWEVYIKMDGGRVTMGKYDILAAIAGQGLAGDSEWDGIVRIEDTFQMIDFSTIRKEIADAVSGSKQTPERGIATDSFKKINFFSTVVKTLQDTLGANQLIRFDILHNASEMEMRNTTYTENVWHNIDPTVDGTVTTPNCEVDRIEKITSFATPNSGNVTYIVSFNGGDTWYTYASGWRRYEDGYGITAGNLALITTEEWDERLDGSIMVRAILQGDATLTDIQIYTAVIEDSGTVEPQNAVSFAQRYTRIDKYAVKLNYSYEHESEQVTVDHGTMSRLTIENGEFSRINNITIGG